MQEIGVLLIRHAWNIDKIRSHNMLVLGVIPALVQHGVAITYNL